MPLVGFQEEGCNIFTAIIQLRHCCCGEMMCYGENDSLVLCSPHVSWSKTTLARSDTPVLTLALAECREHKQLSNLPVYWESTHKTPANLVRGRGTSVRSLF